MRRVRQLAVSSVLAVSAFGLVPAAAHAACSGANANPASLSASAANHATLCLLNAQRQKVAVAPQVIGRLLERYRTEDRELRACHPRDLIERARDVCRFQNRSLELTPEVLDLAWSGYFGEQ